MSPRTGASASSAWRARAPRWARGLFGAIAFILLAEAVSLLGLIPRAVLPAPFTVLSQAARLLTDRQFLGDVSATLQAWAAALAVTVVIAVPLGVLLGSLPGVRTATRALVEFLRPIPSVALIPLVGLVLGAGLRMVVTLIVYAAVWPVLFNTMYGMDDVDPVAKDTLRSFGFGRLAVIRLVSLPSAAPFIATGIRLASSIAIILDIGTGIITGRISGNGLGAFIADAYTGGANTTLVLAAAVWAGVLGFALNALLTWGERKLFRWHHAYSLHQ